MFVGLQFTIYEKTINYYKWKLGEEGFKSRELSVNCLAGLLAGVVAAALTNGLEAITVAKQTNPQINLIEMIGKEGRQLLTKGLMPRLYYNAAQSVVFFNLVLYIGKLYDVELSDD